MDTRAGRAAWMAERMQEGLSNEPEEGTEYDLDDRAQRIAYMTAKLGGAEFEEVEVPAEAAE